jgi:hypothetical protein
MAPRSSIPRQQINTVKGRLRADRPARVVSLRETPPQAEHALAVLAPHIQRAGEVWGQLTDAQRADLRAHSPVLDEFLTLAERFTSWPR